MNEKKLTFRENMSLLRFGFRQAGAMSPSFFPLILTRALLLSARPLIVLFFSAQILNELSGAQNVRTILIYAAITVGVTFFITAVTSLMTREVETYSSSQQVFMRLQNMVAERFAGMDFAYSEDGVLNEKLAAMEVYARGNHLGLMSMFTWPPYIASSLFSVIFAAMLLFTPLSAGASPRGLPALIVYGFFAIGMVVSLKMNGLEKKLLEGVYRDNAKANTALPFYNRYTNIDGATKEIRIYNQAESIQKILKRCFPAEAWANFFFKTGHMGGFSDALLAVISGSFYLIVGLAALDGSVAVGGIVQSVGAVTVLATSVAALVSQAGRFYYNASFLQPLRDYLELPSLLQKGSRPVPAEQNHVHELEFRNVSFRYPGTEQYALRDLTLKLRAGQRLAVVGLNGSGKTTMIKLLCRLYDPTEGEILLDGVNIKEYDYEQYLSLFSVVFQDFALFPLELGKNVAAAAEYDEKLVRDYLDGAGFTERLQKMPGGLDTMLYRSYDEEGTQVSGGEAQKIALARALYKNAPIVILDEPTAALDPVAEYEVYTTFERTIGNKTAVFISHRLSSCRFCHDIAVFEGGRLIQRGGHEELLADSGGRYSELWSAQAKHYHGQAEAV